MRIATKTLQAIDQELKKDQGAKWRGILRKTMGALEDAYNDKEESHRSHMGASLMAKKCGRAIWYSFRWATKSQHEGRMVRLFNRGHLEEGRIVALLELIGATVWQMDENGKQFRISGSHGHYGGSGDGIAKGIPDLATLDEACLLEFKTHNEKSFTKLKSEGVKYAKPEHWGQMQQYMEKFKLNNSLYIAVNKNTDELHAEIITLETEAAQQLVERADKLVWLQEAPSKIGNPPSPGNFDCKFCDHRAVCHLGAQPDFNCRTCKSARPVEGGNGLWFCDYWKVVIPKESQKHGCENWVKHPAIGG